MTRRPFMILAFGVALLGLLVLAAVGFGGRGSPRDYIAGRYDLVSTEDGGRSAVYRSTDPPSRVTEQIASAWKPAQRHTDPTGFFLRYSSAIVAVTPEGSGSRIWIDDEQRGYNRWYPYVGGWWGTYSGPGETFRGGGPGGGK